MKKRVHSGKPYREDPAGGERRLQLRGIRPKRMEYGFGAAHRTAGTAGGKAATGAACYSGRVEKAESMSMCTEGRLYVPGETVSARIG
ncbi:hypothetical protein DWY69_22865 [Eisenbergiella massiliensis]|uniref:Uncharacterized protein n=2 Tax=Eisenbergiella TaxID=1432051 RepID=A0A3E3IJ40_9FIRM|nr:hypothetical protein DWY69_22865 [Eisenbergiella massiliensis]